MFKTVFLQKNVDNFKTPRTDFSLTSANKPQNSIEFYICKFEVNRDLRTRCTNSWLDLTLKCNANTCTFVKVHTQIEDNCRRTIS